MPLLPLRCLRVFSPAPSTLTRDASSTVAYLFTRPTVVKAGRRDRLTHYLTVTVPNSTEPCGAQPLIRFQEWRRPERSGPPDGQSRTRTWIPPSAVVEWGAVLSKAPDVCSVPGRMRCIPAKALPILNPISDMVHF